MTSLCGVSHDDGLRHVCVLDRYAMVGINRRTVVDFRGVRAAACQRTLAATASDGRVGIAVVSDGAALMV